VDLATDVFAGMLDFNKLTVNVLPTPGGPKVPIGYLAAQWTRTTYHGEE